MNEQFHTPSLGDEVFAVTDVDSNTNTSFETQQQQSKRMRGNMDNSVDEYHSGHDESFVISTHPTVQMTSPASTITATAASRKQLTTSGDPNEPPKPLSAYALFFRDTVSAIKQQNPNCSFQEISRIVASMWEALDPAHKGIYNSKNEHAKSEYIKQMRIYRQQQLEQQPQIANINPSTQTMQSKPAVFTISRPNSENDVQQFSNPATITQYQQQTHQYQHQYDYQQQNVHHQQQQQQQQQMSVNQPQQQMIVNQPQQQISPNSIETKQQQQIQLLTEAGSVQKCIRENCNKRAIINPDWEDEYCSNECVVIHCRNVFNAWVQANIDARSQ